MARAFLRRLRGNSIASVLFDPVSIPFDSLLFAGAGRYTSRAITTERIFPFWNLSRATSLSSVRGNLSRSRHWDLTPSRANFAGRTHLRHSWTNSRQLRDLSWKPISARCASLDGSFLTG